MLALVGCLGFIILYVIRVNISVAIVCMVNHTHLAMEMGMNKIDSVNESQERAECANELNSHKEVWILI